MGLRGAYLGPADSRGHEDGCSKAAGRLSVYISGSIYIFVIRGSLGDKRASEVIPVGPEDQKEVQR